MSVFLFGASGYIGSAFKAELERRGYPCIPCDRNGTTNSHGVVPLLIINCTGLVKTPSVSANDEHRCETILSNVVFPERLVEECRRLNTPLLHVSTGALYRGDNHGKGWSETDAPTQTFDSGANWYIGSKELAERVVMSYPQTYCCRLNRPFDHLDSPRNYLSKLDKFNVIHREVHSISHRYDFVNACIDLAFEMKPFGIYNMTNPGTVNTVDLAERVKKIGHDTTIKGGNDGCVLNTDKLASVGIKMRPVEDALEDALRNWTPA